MLVGVPSLAVEDRLVDVHERINRSYADLFDLIVEFDRREAYLVDGARNMADWLAYRFGYSEHTSRELCRIAAALQSLPAGPFARGYWANIGPFNYRGNRVLRLVTKSTALIVLCGMLSLLGFGIYLGIKELRSEPAKLPPAPSLPAPPPAGPRR